MLRVVKQAITLLTSNDAVSALTGYIVCVQQVCIKFSFFILLYYFVAFGIFL
jgi:hypothetical protein